MFIYILSTSMQSTRQPCTHHISTPQHPVLDFQMAVLKRTIRLPQEMRCTLSMSSIGAQLPRRCYQAVIMQLHFEAKNSSLVYPGGVLRPHQMNPYFSIKQLSSILLPPPNRGVQLEYSIPTELWFVPATRLHCVLLTNNFLPPCLLLFFPHVFAHQVSRGSSMLLFSLSCPSIVRAAYLLRSSDMAFEPAQSCQLWRRRMRWRIAS